MLSSWETVAGAPSVSFSLPLPLSLYSAMAFSQLRSSEITYRAGGLAIVQQTVRKVSDPAALEELMKDLSAFVAGNHIFTCSLCIERATSLLLFSPDLTRSD